MRDINLEDKHERRALKTRIGAASSCLIPVKTGGPKKFLKNLEHGYEAPVYELEDLEHINSEFTPEEKIQAVMAYLATGNTDVAEQFCNVSARTIRYWKAKAKWWKQAVAICRARMSEQLDIHFTDILHLATEELFDRISKGDIIVDKEGRKQRRPIRGRELAAIINTIFDKRATARGDPTQITHKTEQSTEARLEDLKDAFEDYSKKWHEDREKQVVSEQ